MMISESVGSESMWKFIPHMWAHTCPCIFFTYMCEGSSHSCLWQYCYAVCHY